MNEGQIRDAVIAKVARTAAGADAAFISEMFVDSFARRADLVVANGKLAVFEIKSHRDTLERLDGQVESYCRFFEQVTVVCAERHLSGVELATPLHVGIWCVTGSGALKTIRAAKVVPQEAVESWLSFLPVDELRALLRHHGLRSAGRRDELIAQAKLLPLRRVRGYVLSYLKRREDRIARRIERDAARPNQVTQTCSAEERLERYLRLIGPSPAVAAIPRRTAHSSKKSSTSAPLLSSGSPVLRAKLVEKSS